jgi:hypothetical protein
MKTQMSPLKEEKICSLSNALSCLEFDSTLPLQNKFMLLNSLSSDISSSDEESTFGVDITGRRDDASAERDTRRKATKETRRIMTEAERKAKESRQKKNRIEEMKMFDAVMRNQKLASPSSSSSSDAFDAVKDAERKARNAASAKESRQKKNRMWAMRYKQVEEMEMGNQKLKDKINMAKRLINAMSSLVLDAKVQNLFGTTAPSHKAVDETKYSVEEVFGDMRQQKAAPKLFRYEWTRDKQVEEMEMRNPYELFCLKEKLHDMRQQKVAAAKLCSKMSERSIRKENNRRLKWQTTKNAPFTHR